MAKIDVAERDILMLSNVAKLLKMAKFELSGDEVIVASQTFSYVGSLIKKVDEANKKPEEKKPVVEDKPKRRPGRKAKAKVVEE